MAGLGRPIHVLLCALAGVRARRKAGCPHSWVAGRVSADHDGDAWTCDDDGGQGGAVDKRQQL